MQALRSNPFVRLSLAVLALLAAGTARAVDLAGTYEAAGKVLSQAEGPAGGPVSLEALFALEFDHERAATIHSAATKVTFEQADGGFRVKCLDPDGLTTWKGEWKRLQGYDYDADKVKLLLRATRYGDDGFLFLLSHDKSPDLLFVEVRRIVSNWYGPTMKTIGTFYFLRVAE